MAIVIATVPDYKGIRTIWEERFTTESKYLEVMFTRIMPLCTSYIYKNEERLSNDDSRLWSWS